MERLGTQWDQSLPTHHSWAGLHSLPHVGQLLRPRCHSNSQTGSPDTHWAHSAGPEGLWKPLLWALSCSLWYRHRKTLHSQLAGARKPQTPHQGSIHTCSADTRRQDTLATVAQEMQCGHQGNTHGGCVCSPRAWSQPAGAAGVGTAAGRGLGLGLVGGGPGLLGGYPGLRAASGVPTTGFWTLRQGSPESPKTSRGPWSWCAWPACWGLLEGGGRAVCYSAPPPQALAAADSCNGWAAQWHRRPGASECLSCSSWSIDPRRLHARPGH